MVVGYKNKQKNCWFIKLSIPVNGWQKGNVDKMCPFFTDLVEIAKHCLWSWGFAIAIWKRIITLLIPVYTRAMYTQGVVSCVVLQEQPMSYKGGCC